MRRYTGGVAAAITFGMTVVAAVSAAASAPPWFVADKIEAFDGAEWAGLKLGVTTQDGVKKQFRNGRGDFSSSVELEQDGTQGYRVSAIYPNKDKKAPLHAIAVKYVSDADGLPLDKLVEALGPGEEMYPPQERYEEWKVVSYPQKGLLLFALGDRVPLVLMGYPDRIAEAASALLTREPLPVTEYVDPHRDEPRVVTFRDLDISFSVRGDLRLRNESEERREIEREVRSALQPGGGLRWDPSAAGGAYRISVTGSYNNNKNKGDGSVSVTISGITPYGQVSGSGYESFTIDGTSEATQELEDTRYNRSLAAAMREAEADVAQKLQKVGPPPLESFRRGWWDRVVDQYRFKTRGAAAGKTGSLL